MSWQVHVTVATVVPKDNRFLMVYETIDNGTAYNQPAGHLEANESLIEAAIRETLEETRWSVRPSAVLALNQYHAANGHTYVRTTFLAEPIAEDPSACLDPDIIEPMWLTVDQIRQRQDKLRSPMVFSDIERYLSGDHFPLQLLGNLSVDTAPYREPK